MRRDSRHDNCIRYTHRVPSGAILLTSAINKASRAAFSMPPVASPGEASMLTEEPFTPTCEERIALLVYRLQTITWQARHIEELREELARMIVEQSP